MLSILCRIMEIEEGVIRRGRNMLISIEVNANMLTSIRDLHLLHGSIDVKFIFDSVHLGLSSSANILRIADVAFRVVFSLFLLYF